MAVVKVKLKTEYQRKDGTYQVVIYAYDVKPQYIDTGVAVTQDQFQDKQDSWIRKHPDAVLLNQRIEETRIRVRDGMIPGVGYVEGMQNHGTKVAFSDYIRRRAKEFKAEERIDMELKCNRMADEMEELAGRKVYFHEINIRWIRAYYAACLQIPNVNNTIQRKIKNLRTLFGQAAGEGIYRGVNPFDQWVVKLDEVKKDKLTPEEIARIEALDLSPGRTIFHVRNAFLISYFCQGMRFENVCLLRWEDVQDGQVIFRANKGKKWRQVALHSRLQAVLNHYIGAKPYILPFFKREVKGKADLRNMKGAANAIVNELLKAIGEMADISTPLTFHLARHAFAYGAKKKKIPVSLIQDALTHSDSSTTEAYLDSFDDDEINDAMSVMWE